MTVVAALAALVMATCGGYYLGRRAALDAVDLEGGEQVGSRLGSWRSACSR